MLIDSREISAYLPSCNRVIDVRTPHGKLAFTATVPQILRMASKEIIAGDVDKKQWLRYVVLQVGVRFARQVAGINARGGERLPIAQDQFTITQVNSDHGPYYEHNDEVCAAYRPA